MVEDNRNSSSRNVQKAFFAFKARTILEYHYAKKNHNSVTFCISTKQHKAGWL